MSLVFLGVVCYRLAGIRNIVFRGAQLARSVVKDGSTFGRSSMEMDFFELHSSGGRGQDDL